MTTDSKPLTQEFIDALRSAQEWMQHPIDNSSSTLFGSHTYADYETVVDTVKPYLNKNGLIFQHISHLMEGGACIETKIIGHGSEISSGPIFIPSTKRDAHGFAGAITYAKRYSLSLVCGVGDTKDDDANLSAASTRAEQGEDMFVVRGLGGKVITAKESPEEIIMQMRYLIGDPSAPNAQDLFDKNKKMLDEARKQATDSKTVQAFDNLYAIYSPNEERSEKDEAKDAE